MTYLFIHQKVFIGDFRDGAFDLFADLIDEGVSTFQAQIADLLPFFRTQFMRCIDEMLTDQRESDGIANLRWIVDAGREEMIELC